MVPLFTFGVRSDFDAMFARLSEKHLLVCSELAMYIESTTTVPLLCFQKMPTPT